MVFKEVTEKQLRSRGWALVPLPGDPYRNGVRTQTHKRESL